MIRWYTVPEIWCVTDAIIFHFGPFFALLPSYQPEKSKFWKNAKNNWRYHHFIYVYQKLWSDDERFLRYGAWQMNWELVPSVMKKPLNTGSHTLVHIGFVEPTSIRLVSFNLWMQNHLFLHGFIVLLIYDIHVIRTLFIVILFIFLYFC